MAPPNPRAAELLGAVGAQLDGLWLAVAFLLPKCSLGCPLIAAVSAQPTPP